MSEASSTFVDAILLPLDSGNSATPPVLVNYIAAVEPLLALLLLITILSSFLIPTLIVLCYISTPATRTKPVFIMNVSSIALGLALGAIDVSLQTRAILAKPLIRPLETAFTCIMILAPFCAELVLIVRVVAVYPPYSISWSGRVLVYAPIAALKIARTVNLVLCVVTWVQLNAGATSFSQSGHAAWDLPNAKVEWILQLVDMTFVSALFLARLHKSTRIQHKTSVTLSSRIRTLFWIAASNLVFPVLLNIIQLWYIFRDKNFFHGTYVYFVNVHVQIIGALLATIWSAGMQRPSTFPADSDYTSRRRREIMVINGLQPAGSTGSQRAVVSPSEWLQTWTAASDDTRASTDPDLGRRDRMFDV